MVTPKQLAGRALGGPSGVEAVKRLPRLLDAGGRALPDFMIIGAQKSGTTTLYDYVVQHRDVRAAMTKEVHFFDNRHGLGERWYRAHFPRCGASRGSRTWLTGEASPYYLLHPQAPRRAVRLVPGAKLIVALRHPVDRAYSHYQHERLAGREVLTFEDAVERESVRTDAAWSRLAAGETDVEPDVQHYSYMRRGWYAEQLLRWLPHYPREQLHVVQAEHLFAEPASVMSGVFGFLGLSPAPYLVTRRLNAGRYEQMAAAVRARLGERFRQSTHRTEQLLGQPLEWDL